VASPVPSPPPPIPYWPSIVVKPETVRGVQTYHVNLILDIVFGVFALLIGLTSIYVATATDPATAIAIAAITGSAACGLLIVFVINFIVSLMSVLRMHHGADEYGPDHGKNARRGILFKWIGTTLSTLAAILVVYLIFAGTSALFLGASVSATVYVPLLVTVFWTAGVGAKAQMYRYMIRSLQPPETRRWSDIASCLIPSLGAIGIVVVGYVTVRIVDLLSSPSSLSSPEAGRLFQLMIGGVFLPPGFALIGYIVFLTIYAKTRERLNAGLAELYRAMPPAPAWAWPAPANPGPMNPMASAASSAVATPPAATAIAVGSFCPRCGHALPADALFCLNCGTQVRT